jgi:hypothetical protein
MTAWSHLPNAAHIDQVLVDLKIHPIEFGNVWDTADSIAWATASAACHAQAERGSAWGSAWDVPMVSSRSAARTAILALIAYDHADEYMTMTPNQAQVWGELSGDPVYVLLRPYLQIRVQIAQTRLETIT